MSVFFWVDMAGVAVFAASGALVASRKEMDLVGFGLIATVTGVGGGTLRDLLLDRPVFWLEQPVYLLLCVTVASVLFFIAPRLERRYPVLLWADAVGLSVFAVLGAALALKAGFGLVTAVVMGVMTATFGGLIRDVLCNEIPLILRREIYATAAAFGAASYVGLSLLPMPTWVAEAGGLVACLVLRSLGLSLGLSLPTYRPRAGRHYPLE